MTADPGEPEGLPEGFDTWPQDLRDLYLELEAADDAGGPEGS